MLLDEQFWCRLGSLIDECWFLQKDVDVIRRRLLHCFIASGMTQANALNRIKRYAQRQFSPAAVPL